MSYPITSSVAYGPQAQIEQYSSIKENKKNIAPYVAAGALLGGLGGGYLGYKSNPFISKDGKVLDSFAQRAYGKYAEKSGGNIKKLYDQCLAVIKNITGAKTPAEIKTLSDANPEAFAEIKSSINLEQITDTNLKENINTIKESIDTKLKNLYQDMKNNIQKCWNKNKKAFEKPAEMQEDMFNSIQEATKGIKLKSVLKYAGIGAAATGAVVFVLHKFLSAKKEVSQQ